MIIITCKAPHKIRPHRRFTMCIYVFHLGMTRCTFQNFRNSLKILGAFFLYSSLGFSNEKNWIFGKTSTISCVVQFQGCVLYVRVVCCSEIGFYVKLRLITRKCNSGVIIFHSSCTIVYYYIILNLILLNPLCSKITFLKILWVFFVNNSLYRTFHHWLYNNVFRKCFIKLVNTYAFSSRCWNGKHRTGVQSSDFFLHLFLNKFKQRWTL